jgi:hypothetical protein
MTVRARRLALAVLAPALIGCGSGGSDKAADTRQSPGATTPAPRPADTRRADPRAAATIGAWVDAERTGEAIRAAAYFSLPAIVLNGPEPLLLRTRDQVRLWNAALPCGATLLRAVDVRGWTIARFRLLERPGRRCDGVGNTATTAFAMREGKIAMWIRVADDASAEKSAPPRPPDPEFLRHGRIEGRRVPTTEEPTPAA